MKKVILTLIALILVVGSVATAGYYYREYQKIKSNPNLVATEEVKIVTEAIKKYMDLPEDEEPTLATVTDQEKLKEQEFFKKSQNGDKVLIYTKARKAILYRPSTGRVLEVAPLAIGPTEGTETVAAAPIPVTIYNGSAVEGLAATVEDRLKNLTEIKVTVKENAQKKDYPKTLVVDVSGSNGDLAKKIAETLQGEVSPLPSGEKKPDTGVLIIAAK